MIFLNWFNKWKLNLNPNKCEANIFSLRQSSDPAPIFLNHGPINCIAISIWMFT